MKKPLASTVLGDYIAGEKFERLPKRVITRAIQCIQDSLGCILGAYSTTQRKILTGFVRERGGRAEAHLLGSRTRTACTTAAFANALLINTLDYDDIHEGHLGATAVAAAFALGEKADCTGRELIEATVVGYEVAARVGRALRMSADRRWIHGHGTWQTFGAAAAAAKALGLSSQKAAHALAIAGANAPVASVMKTVYSSRGPDMVKNNFGTSAEVGVTAALLAGRGLEGQLDIFEGETGFWRMFGTDHCDFGKIVHGLGRNYEILNVGFKLHPACRVLQSSIEAVSACARRHRIDPLTIDNIRLRAVPRACEWPFTNTRPRHMWAAQFSTPYAVAVVLQGMEPGPEWFSERTLTNPAVLDLADRIELVPVPKKKIQKKDHSYHVPAEAEIFSRGRVFRVRVDIARGESARPLSAKQRNAKFIRLARHRISEEQAVALQNKLVRLDQVRSVRELAKVMEGSG